MATRARGEAKDLAGVSLLVSLSMPALQTKVVSRPKG